MPSDSVRARRAARQWLLAFALGIGAGTFAPAMAPHIFGANHVFHIVEFRDPDEDLQVVERRLDGRPLFDAWAAPIGHILRSVGQETPNAVLDLTYRSRRDGHRVSGRFELRARGRDCHIIVHITRDAVVASECLNSVEYLS
jgi:hypothetical protein